MTDYLLASDWSLDAASFKRVVLAFNNTEAAAEILSGLTADSYADICEAEEDLDEDDKDLRTRTFFHALNPHLIED